MDEIDFAVLELLLFPEQFSNIVMECRIPTTRHVVGDVLKTLLHDSYVSPLYKDESGNFKRSIGYDSDNMGAFYYQITSKGIDKLDGYLSAHKNVN
ncbi:MAG: hypothetical protein ACI9JN_000462 [Bacteroidia bacterium]|jgi:hypothetical protein